MRPGTTTTLPGDLIFLKLKSENSGIFPKNKAYLNICNLDGALLRLPQKRSEQIFFDSPKWREQRTAEGAEK
jgi:hypothetical protein